MIRNEFGQFVKGREFPVEIEEKRRKGISETKKKQWANPNSKYNNEETRKKVSNSIKKLWKNIEYRNHMSEVHKGHIPTTKGKPMKEWMSSQGIENSKRTRFKKGVIPWITGKTKENNETVRRIGENRKGKNFGIILENHPNWKGGKSFEPYPIIFNSELKEQTRKRDSYQCKECGVYQKNLGYNLDVHHIDGNKDNCDLENLVSLCRSCHITLEWEMVHSCDAY